LAGDGVGNNLGTDGAALSAFFTVAVAFGGDFSG